MITSLKISPKYINQLLKRENIDLIFITSDYKCLNYIRNLKGTCLFCHTSVPIHQFNLNVFYQREAWVLYSDDSFQKRSFHLGRAIQQCGANKVCIVPFPITSVMTGEAI